MFSLSAHNCATCLKYADRPMKEAADYFRNRPDEYVRVCRISLEKLAAFWKLPAWEEGFKRDPASAMVFLMITGYAAAKKEDSCQQLEKIIKKEEP